MYYFSNCRSYLFPKSDFWYGGNRLVWTNVQVRWIIYRQILEKNGKIEENICQITIYTKIVYIFFAKAVWFLLDCMFHPFMCATITNCYWADLWILIWTSVIQIVVVKHLAQWILEFIPTLVASHTALKTWLCQRGRVVEYVTEPIRWLTWWFRWLWHLLPIIQSQFLSQPKELSVQRGSSTFRTIQQGDERG